MNKKLEVLRTMAKRDRFYISKKSRLFVDNLTNMNRTPLGLKDLSRLDLYKIAVALGLNNPQEFDSAKVGLCLLKDLKSTKDTSLFNIILMGVAKNNDEIDEYCDLEMNYTESEKCSNAGFAHLIESIDSTPSDELLRKKMLNELDILFQQNVMLKR